MGKEDGAMGVRIGRAWLDPQETEQCAAVDARVAESLGGISSVSVAERSARPRALGRVEPLALSSPPLDRSPAGLGPSSIRQRSSRTDTNFLDVSIESLWHVQPETEQPCAPSSSPLHSFFL